MKKAVIISIAIALSGCNQTVKNKPMPAEDTVVQEVCDGIPNHVLLDTLLRNITKQQNVKVLAELDEKQKNNSYICSGGGYSFQVFLNENDGNTLFSDGKKKIAFKNCSVLCYQDTNYICNDFGFNSYNRLVAPKIIEVCGMKFLYADMVFPCNGRGCGNILTLIYDLREKKPTFLGNYHIPFDGFLLSDFNDDHIPDLLVIAKSYNHEIKGIDTPEFNMKLLVYSYDNGTFKLNKDIFYDLYGVGGEDEEKIFSIEKNNWFKNNTDSINNILMQTDSITHNEKRDITFEVMNTTKVTGEFKKFDMDIFHQCMEESVSNDLGYVYRKKLDSGIDIEIDGRFNKITYRETHPDSYFSICKIYDSNGLLKEKGLMITHSSFSKIGTWYYYDETGKLIEEINDDRHYKFTFNDVLEFCRKENIPIARGMDYHSKMILNDNNEPYKVEYIFSISRGADDYMGVKYWWLIDHFSTFNYIMTTICLDGQTGKVLFRDSGVLKI